MDFSGKTILVTGAAGQIGGAVATRFAGAGADVALTDLDEERLQALAGQLRATGVTVITHVADVTDNAAVEELVADLERSSVRLDMLFNNAGYQGEFARVFEYSPEDFAKVIQVNLIGAFHVLRSVGRHMVANGGGAIVNTASMAGVDGPPNMAAYGAGKFGIVGLTQTAAKDLAPYNVRVNSISPAFIGPGFMWERQVERQAAVGSQYFDADPTVVAQQMISAVPMRRYGAIEEIPGTVIYLMSSDASYVTGVNIPISGGIG